MSYISHEGNARDRITVHFTRMDYNHEQTIMLHGKFCKFIQQVGNILRFRLSRLRVVVETVERVEDNNAAAAADNEFMSLTSTRSGETLPSERYERRFQSENLPSSQGVPPSCHSRFENGVR